MPCRVIFSAFSMTEKNLGCFKRGKRCKLNSDSLAGCPVVMLATASQGIAQTPSLRPRHHQRSYHRWHRLALVFRRRRHPRGPHRGDRQPRWRAAQAHHRRARQSRGARLHRYAGPVRDSPFWSTRACHRKSSRASPPRSPAKAPRSPRSTPRSLRPIARYEHYHITPDWPTFRQYFARLENQGIGINLASYVGATQVRRMVLGDADVQPTAEQLAQMQALVREAMQDGAVGVSTALAICARALRQDRRIDRAGRGRRQIRRHLCDAHAQRRRRRPGGDRRSGADRPRGAYSGRDLALEGRGQIQLGTHARGGRARSRRRAPPASTSPPTPTPIPRGSTSFPHSFRRGRTMAATPNSSSG